MLSSIFTAVFCGRIFLSYKARKKVQKKINNAQIEKTEKIMSEIIKEPAKKTHYK